VNARGRAAAGAVLVLSLSLTFAAHPWSDTSITDLPLFHSQASLFVDGQIPYRDVAFEYPPLAAPVLALPAVFGDYRLAFAGLVLALAAATMLLTGRLARVTGGDERTAVLAVALAPLLTGAMIRTHFDLAPVVLTIAALAALLSRRPALGFALIGLGAMTKVFPLVIAPVALAWLLGRGERRAAVRGAAALALTLAVIAAVAVVVSPAGAFDAVRYQVERPPQVESGPATALRAVAAFGGGPIESVESHRSHGVAHPAAEIVGSAFAGALAGLVGLLAVAAARRRGSAEEDARALVIASLGAVATFMLFGKVLSPQFMVWLVPLMALAAAWRQRALAGALALAIALTLAEFPGRYFGLVDGEPLPVVIVAARNALLLGAIALAVRAATARSPAAVSARSSAPARRLLTR
jgi:Glycosyltransferase family 87